MHLLGIIVRLLVFFASSLGYWEFFRRKTKINIYFLPIITVAVQSIVLFLSGLLNVLDESAFLLTLAGLVALIYFMIRLKGFSWIKCYVRTGFVYFGIVMIVVLLTVNGKVFSHYDNFSHWALVVKQMLSTNRFPNFEDTVIVYQEYPLGSAAFIYYVAKIIGTAESVWMFAQAYMITVCILPVFVFCKRNRILSILFMLFATNFIFVYNIAITELLVDTLLPLAAMSMLLYVYLYTGKRCRFGVEAYLSVPLLIWILQIKNAGIYFCVVASIWILLGIKLYKNYFLRTVLIALSPYISLILWQQHCEYVFMKAETSRHAMTVQNYIMELKTKSPKDIWTICSSWIKFCLTYKDVGLTFLCFVVAGIIWCFLLKKQMRTFCLMASFSLVMYVTYQIGTMGMYVFSMPLSEAMTLAGATRYCKSILLAIFFIILILYMKIISSLNCLNTRNVLFYLGLIAAIATMWRFTGDDFRFFFNIQGDRRPKERSWIETNVKKYSIPYGAKCCIFAPEKSRGYMLYICKYVLQSSNISALYIDSEEDLELLSDCNYIFIYDEDNQIIQKWIRNNYPDQINQDVIIKGD